MTTATHKTGSEGPRHDPYGYEEWTVRRPDNPIERATLHFGLTEWLDLYDRGGDGHKLRISQQYRNGERCGVDLIRQFEHYCGVSFKALQRAVDRLENPTRCPHCGSRKLDWCGGFPGEELLVCQACGRIAASHINLHAVE